METKHQTISELEAEWALVQKAQKDPALFAPLYTKYFKPIFLFIFRRISEEELAGDLTALVFSKALYNLHTYNYRGLPFSAWLYRIALNEIQAHYRQTKKERVVSFSSEALSILSQDIQEEEATQLQEEREQALLLTLEDLAEEEMVYIELRFFEGRSFKEIADIQQISENNAKVKTYRIIERLRKILIRK
ncbi:MAG: sigma-70 family RNA polymerase sigma factor [Cytophagaceae bacterium]|nr:sigma-70 family RNA polymerase sigma factor [Cytophagaceae bacterium]